jgi:hypothetical protein
MNNHTFSSDKEAGALLLKKLARIRTDHQWVEGVGVGGGQPESSAMEGCSLLVNQHVDVELAQGVATIHQQRGGV